MRLKTPITRDALKNHWAYNGWKYAAAIVLSLLIWNVAFSVTRYQPPEEKRIDVFIQSPAVSPDAMNAYLAPIWKQAAPEMEAVNAAVLMDANEAADLQLSTYIMVGEGDIYLLAGKYFKTWAANGAFLPLEGLAESGAIHLGETDVSAGWITCATEYDDQDIPLNPETHLYGVPLDSFTGFLQGLVADPRGMFAAIAVNSQNEENVIPFFDALLQSGRGESAESAPEQE